MTQKEIKQEADKLVERHFKSWFLILDDEMKDIKLNPKNTPKGIIRAAIETAQVQITEANFWSGMVTVNSLQYRMITDRITGQYRILKELQSRL